MRSHTRTLRVIFSGACRYNHARASLRPPELCETLGPDVLTGMLDAGQQVGDELVDGAFVLDGTRDALSDLDLVALTARMEEEEEEDLFVRNCHTDTFPIQSFITVSSPEVSGLGSQVFVHGVQGAHASVFL